MFDAQLWNLPNDEMLIMVAILSKRTEADESGPAWVLNTIEIQNRLQNGGMGINRLQKCLNNLQKKGYLVKERLQGGWQWKVYENPSNTFNTPPKTNIQRAPKPKVEKTYTRPKSLNDIPYEEMTDRQKLIWRYNNEDKIKK
jgi:hypothetical protein